LDTCLLLALPGFFDFPVEGGLNIGGKEGDTLLGLDFPLDLLSVGVLLGETDESDILAPGSDLTARLLALTDLFLGEAKLVLVFNHLMFLSHTFVAVFLGFLGRTLLTLLLVLTNALLLLLLTTLLVVSGTTGVNTFRAGVVTVGSFNLSFKSVTPDEIFFFFEDATFGADEFVVFLVVHVSAKTNS